MQFLCGKKVLVHDVRVPKIRLSTKVIVSDSFRNEMNAWLLENFGYEFVLKNGQVIGTADSLIMNPVTYQQVLRATKDI